MQKSSNSQILKPAKVKSGCSLLPRFQIIIKLFVGSQVLLARETLHPLLKRVKSTLSGLNFMAQPETPPTY